MGIRIPNKILYMYNYLSVGVDAQVALSFHKTRESMTFSNRMFNKVPYLKNFSQQPTLLLNFSFCIFVLEHNKSLQQIVKI